MKRLILSVLITLVGTFAFSQSADVVTKIIEAENVTYGQVCYMSAVHQKLVSENASYSDAINALFNEKQIAKIYVEDETPTLEQISSIVLKMWPKVNDSLFFRISKGSPRYSFKLLQAKGVVRSSFDPKQKISGRDYLNILTAAMMTFDPETEGMSMEVSE